MRYGLPRWLSGKESTCQCRRHRRYRFNPWVGKIPLQEEMTTHSNILAWKIPWTEEPGGPQSMGSHRVGHDLEIEHPYTRIRHLSRGSLLCFSYFFLFAYGSSVVPASFVQKIIFPPLNCFCTFVKNNFAIFV